jgi:hypothetical protein
MKTQTLIKPLLVLFAGGLFGAAALAGPGPQYWSNHGKSSAKPALTEVSSPRLLRACSDARLVSIAETKPAWSNGRGPLVTTEVGQKLMCASCDTPAVVMKPSGPNARGPMMPVEIKGQHDCTKNGCGTAVMTVNH